MFLLALLKKRALSYIQYIEEYTASWFSISLGLIVCATLPIANDLIGIFEIVQMWSRIAADPVVTDVCNKLNKSPIDAMHYSLLASTQPL